MADFFFLGGGGKGYCWVDMLITVRRVEKAIDLVV